MTTSIIIGIACLILGAALGYLIFRYFLTGKYNEMVENAKKEAEVPQQES